jgi:putative mRNA 3-end processing factor
MGTRVSGIWNDHPNYLRDPSGFEKALRWTKRVRGKSDRFKALEADVIVTTSGMLDGGPAIWYLNRLRHDSANAILLTGYQAPGSGGRSLVDTGIISIYNRKTRIELEIDKFDLSNHAGRSELVDFARACNPRHLILFHTPDEDVQEFADLFGPDPPFEVLIPINGRDLIIDMDAE